jgi:hypothetical protein
MKHTLLLLLLLSGALLAFGQSNSTAGSIVHVETDHDLYTALTVNAETIVLHNDVAMGAEFEQFKGSPLQIDRQATGWRPGYA